MGSARRAGSHTGESLHVGRVFEICVTGGRPWEKIPKDVLYLKETTFEHAMFQQLGSSPAAMAAVKACDAYGLLAGNTIQQADAEAACVNAQLEDPPTNVRLPKK